MKIRIRLKQENNQKNGVRNIQFDIDELRGNKQLLQETLTDARIQEMLNTEGTLKELGMERYNKDIQQVKQWNCKMWQTLAQNLQEIQTKHFPLTEKRPPKKTHGANKK